MRIVFFVVVLTLISTLSVIAQGGEKITGPVIENFGSTWEIPEADFIIPEGQKFKMVFDIATPSRSPKLINSSINSIARFINMSVNAGVAMDEIEIIAVFHGGAAKDAMNDAYYLRKYQISNPNRALISDLKANGVKFYLCGQTMNARKLPHTELLNEVNLALSAMTVIGVYVSQGYALIKF